MNKIVALKIIFISLLIVGCSSTKETANPLLHDIWALESINGKAYSRTESQSLHPTIEIYLAEERFSGNTGCNNMNGKLKVEGSTISFSDIITTKMFCADVDETTFLTALGQVKKYKIEKLKLYLFENEKELLVFQKID
jgi:heat shock protein HslJ